MPDPACPLCKASPVKQRDHCAESKACTWRRCLVCHAIYLPAEKEAK